MLLRPLAYRDPSHIMLVVERNSMFATITTSYQNYKDWRDQSRSFESMEASCFTNLTLTGRGEPERFKGRYVTSGLLPLLGVTPVIGRAFFPEEDRVGGPPVAMISYSLWHSRFGGSPDWIGKTIALDSQPYTLDRCSPFGFSVSSSCRYFGPV